MSIQFDDKQPIRIKEKIERSNKSILGLIFKSKASIIDKFFSSCHCLSGVKLYYRHFCLSQSINININKIHERNRLI